MGLSQQAVAARAKVRQATVSAVETGQDVKISTIEKVATAVGVSLSLNIDPLPLPQGIRESKSCAQRQFLRRAMSLNPFKSAKIHVPSVSWSDPW